MEFARAIEKLVARFLGSRTFDGYAKEVKERVRLL